MYKILGVVWTVALTGVLAVTQEELAQYVAQQQTASLGAAQPRRQAFIYQPQAKALGQGSPRDQIYQFQPKAAPAYQVGGGAASEQQYYQPAVQVQQPQPQYYQPKPQPTRKLVRPQQPGQQLDDNQQPLEEYEPAQPYQFGFDIKDDEFTNYQNRKEQREGDKISGSYSVVDSDGFIRTVTYTADPLEGFKADVVREPTDIRIKVPQPQPQEALGGLARKQQTQQYLQGAAQPKQQYIYRPEHTQVVPRTQEQQLRQFAAPVQYQQPQYQQPQYQQQYQQ